MANNKPKKKSSQRKKAGKPSPLTLRDIAIKREAIRQQKIELDKLDREYRTRERAERSRNKSRKIAEKQRRSVSDDIGKLKALSQFGIYRPKNKRKIGPQTVLTRAEKAAIRRNYKKWARFIRGEYVPVKIPQRSKKTADNIRKKAGQAGFTATDKVIFYPRGRNTTKARIISNPETGYEIVATREFHSSKKGKAGEVVHIPLASADELDIKREQLRLRFRRLSGQAGSKGKIRFYVEGKYGSHRVFMGDDFDGMWKELNQYRNTQGEMYDFISTIKLGVVKFDKGRATTKRNKVMTANDKLIKKMTAPKGMKIKRVVKIRKVNATGRSK